MHHSHHSDAAAESAAAASWFVAMALFAVLVAALVIAMFAWAPWDGNGVIRTNSGSNQPNIEQNNITTGQQPEQTQPAQQPQQSP